MKKLRRGSVGYEDGFPIFPEAVRESQHPSTPEPEFRCFRVINNSVVERLASALAQLRLALAHTGER